MKINNTGNLKDGHVKSAAARIRENQRRSRTRRKEYVQHLEQRLRNFERLGIAVTQEVQKAGRKVKRENEMLRSLLLLHGVTEKSVEEYLESQGQTASSSQPQSLSVASIASSKMNLSTALNHPISNYHHSTATSPDLHSDRPPHRPISNGPESLPPKSDRKTDMDVLPCQGSNASRAARPNPAVAERNSEKHHFASIQGTGQSMSCVAAAKIIESMQNYSDFRDVRSELGCDSESTCFVKNMSIFDILDR